MVFKSTKLNFKSKLRRIFKKGGPGQTAGQNPSVTSVSGGASDKRLRKAPSTNPSPANAASQSNVSTTPLTNPSAANGLPQSNVLTTPPTNPSSANTVHQSNVSPTRSTSPSPPSAVHQTNPSTALSSCLWTPQALWEDAYKQLSRAEPELITEFERTLCGNFASNEQVQSIVQAQLDNRIEDQWAVNVLGKDVKIRKMGEDLIKFLVWSKDLVSTSLSSQPHLALAWSGVTMLLPLVLTPSQESDAMIQGLDHLTSTLKPYQIRTQLQRNTGSDEYRSAVVNLYSCCLEYQVRMACHLSKRTATRGVLALAKSGQWTALITKIDVADQECSKYETLIDKKQEDEMWKLQTKYMEEQEKILKQLYKLKLDDLNTREAEREDSLRDKVIECLVGDYPEQKDANPEAVENTCRWFLDDSRFHKWRDSTTSSLLWLYAGAGCGKSVLSRALIDEDFLIPSGRLMTSTVCYFFFKNLDNRNRGADALRGILHQLYTQKLHTNLISVAYDATKLYKQKLGSMFNTLWDLLLNTARHPAAGEIICVLDALDECQADARKAFLAKLVHFFNASTKDTNPQQPCIKFLITSQYAEDIDIRFAQLDPASNFIKFPGDDRSDLLRQEIDLVIDRRIPEKVPKLNWQSQLLLAKHLKSIEHRTYMWLHLVLEEIEEKFPSNSTLTRIKVLINELPSTVNEAYEGILHRSPDPKNLRVILQIVLAAKRELTVNELIVAWHVTRSNQPRSYQDLDLPDEGCREGSLQSICGSFIRIVSSKVMLIHDTARQYLVRTPPPPTQLSLDEEQQRRPSPVTASDWRYSLSLIDCNYLCAQICMTVICFDPEKRNYPWITAGDSVKYPDSFFEEHLESDQYLHEYASKMWADHFRISEDISSKEDIRRASYLCDAKQRPFKIWFPPYSWSQCFAYLGNEPTIMVASLLGLARVVEQISSDGGDVNAIGGYYGTALQAASAGGFERVVQILLDHKAKANAEGGHYGTALQAASWGGHEIVVQTLLNQGADVNIELNGGFYYSALQIASMYGDESVVQILLKHGADVNYQGEAFGSALQIASESGHERVVEILLRDGADVNAKGYHYDALQRASACGHERVVQLLLDNNAEVNSQGGEYGTALQLASEGGYETVVQMLLHKGADIDAQDGTEGNALQRASAYGHERVVQILLDNKADINAPGGEYGTALQVASEGGHERVVEMLLENGARVSAEGSEYGSALQAAAAGGNERVVQILLDNGAKVNAQGGRYGTALQAAKECGHKRVVQMLLAAGAEELTMSDGSCGTPTTQRSSNSHSPV